MLTLVSNGLEMLGLTTDSIEVEADEQNSSASRSNTDDNFKAACSHDHNSLLAHRTKQSPV